ncbi:cleavage and polyadenylation specificity factor, putative [Bodo saltans]|uniref:Cleavage and polyadenylation specificity factor, putative n=1 Tax=Bodo saltans TaxID=75058 RepID=A0A0S4JP16_BODSA|nr:cleavage and polyadenylation specificity factor, putative [Bodo saltans]|eukprot:CUG91086.1 cleavage and polyadenylation specificity factor, putative [Bodo saltans]
MPFIISTTQKATSTSKSVVGKFFGTNEASCAVVSSVDRLLVFMSCNEAPVTTSTKGAPQTRRQHADPHRNNEENETTGSVTPKEWLLAAELPLYATILSLEAVPILDPRTGTVERHLLFILTGKDQFLLYALTRNTTVCTSPASCAPPPSSSTGIQLMLLFGDIIESSFYQPHYDGALLTAVTSEQVLRGHPLQTVVPSASSADNATAAPPSSSATHAALSPPMVVISMFHKTILLIDIACCLNKAALLEDPFDNNNEEEAAGRPQPSASKKAKKLRQRAISVASLFSEAYWTAIVEPRKDHAALTVQFLDETTIVDIAFGYATTSVSGDYPLYVLHSDAKMRNHLVQYHLGTNQLPAAKAVPSGGPNKGASDAVQLAILGLSFDAERPKFALKWSRVGALQTDLELEARRVIPIHYGVCVIGVQLVTYIVQKGVSVTEAFPPHPDGAGEIHAVTLLDNGRSALVAFQNGGICQVTVRQRVVEMDDDIQVLRRASNQQPTLMSKDSVDLKLKSVTQRCGTTPSSIAVLSQSCRGGALHHHPSAVVIVSSLMGPLLQLDLDASHQAPIVLLENAGPILSLASIPDEGSMPQSFNDLTQHTTTTAAHASSSSMVVASNGVDADGGLYVLRTAVNFQEDMVLPWLEGLSNVFLVSETLCFAFPTHSRFLRFIVGSNPSTESLSNETDESLSRSVTLEEGEPAQLPMNFEDETILLAAHDGALVQVTRHSCSLGIWGESTPRACVTGLDTICHAAHSSNHLIIAQGKCVTILEIKPKFKQLHSIICDNELSCVSISGGTIGTSSSSSSSAEAALVVVYGEWLRHSLTIRPIGEHWNSRATSLALSSVPKSLVLCNLANGLTGTTVCCGLSDGSLSFVAVHDDTLSLELVQEAKLSRRPIHLQQIPRGLQGSSNAVLCCCDVPAIIYEQDGLIAVTGVALDDMELACYSSSSSAVGARGRKSAATSPVDRSNTGSLLSNQDHQQFPAMVVASPTQEIIRLGGLRSVQKVSRTASHASSRQTIATVSYLHHFHAIGVAARSVDRDLLMILSPASGFGTCAASSNSSERVPKLLQTAGGGAPTSAVFPLMTNERCTFIESVVIGGPNDKLMSNTVSRKQFQTPSKAQWGEEGWRAQYGLSPFNAVLVGTSMIFADETFPRSCRLIWGAVEDVKKKIGTCAASSSSSERVPQLLQTAGGGAPNSAVFPLMTNERCTFIESVVIGGPNDKLMSNTVSRKQFQTPSKAQWGEEGWRAQYGLSPFNAVLVGTSMIFADETFPRSCRLIWGAVEDVPATDDEQSKQQGPQRVFVQLGDRELSGAATCCCAVPNCPNRIAVGVNGSVHLFRWHSADRTFVVETSLSVGSLLVSLTPLFPKDDTMSGLLVAADWKHSVCIIKVNPIDNSLEVCAKDPSLRGVMDLEVTTAFPSSIAASSATSSAPLAADIRVENAPSSVGYEFLFADDMMNIFSVAQEVIDAAAPNAAVAARRSQSLDDEEEPQEERRASAVTAAAEPKPKRWTARRRLLTTAQAHLGDRISSLIRGDLAPCASLAAHDAIRGASSDRFLFGTIHGALGVMTPLAALPFRVYQLLERHIATVAKTSIGGGLDYEYFRDIAGHGQLRRPPADNPSFGERRAKKRREASDRVPISFTSGKFANKGFVHGDVVEYFLKLTPAEQTLVLDRVNSDLGQDIACVRNGFEEYVTAQPSNNAPNNNNAGTGSALHEVATAGAFSAPAGADDEVDNVPPPALGQPSETATDEANDGLTKWRLPAYPFQVESIKMIIKELLRTH